MSRFIEPDLKFWRILAMVPRGGHAAAFPTQILGSVDVAGGFTQISCVKRYAETDRVDPRVEIRPPPRRGMGSFAAAPIRAGEVVMVWGGVTSTHEDARAGRRIKRGTAVAIAEDRVIGSDSDAPDDPGPAHYLNHSCDPNLWMLNEVTLAARRDIAAAEELTGDYAMWEWDENFVAKWICVCGSPLCRRTVTGRDWRLRSLREVYRGHFSPFINARIGLLERP